MLKRKDDVLEASLDAEMARLAARIGVDDIDEALYFPRFFQIETTRLCNARCTFCAIDQWDKTTAWMSDELWDKIADELVQYSDWIRFVDIQRAGEPMLDKKIADRIKRLKDGGIKHVMITTNASGLNEKNARKILEAGIDELMISIDSVTKENYEATRVGLKYEMVMKNITRYFELRDEINPDSMVRVRGVCTVDPDSEENREELEQWENYWDKHKKPIDRVYMKRLHTWGNQVAFDGGDFQEDIYHPCIIPFGTMHITAMGTIALCGHDFDAKANLGDINTHSIAEVWQADKFREVRSLHAAGRRNEIPFCPGCQTFDEEMCLEEDKNRIKNAYSSKYKDV